MDLFTMGYEGMTVDGFIRRLLRYKIDIVADVRLNPISRKPFFSKTSLAQILGRHQIHYLHFRELGTPQAIRAKVMQTGDYRKFMLEYSKFLKTKIPILRELYCLVKAKRVALICLEKDPEKCHRSAVAGAIKELDGNGLCVRSL
jgi:uncharacterized protein (DUF488 family)